MPTISLDNKLSSTILIFQVDPKNQSALIDAGIENSKKIMEKKQDLFLQAFTKALMELLWLIIPNGRIVNPM